MLHNGSEFPEPAALTFLVFLAAPTHATADPLYLTISGTFTRHWDYSRGAFQPFDPISFTTTMAIDFSLAGLYEDCSCFQGNLNAPSLVDYFDSEPWQTPLTSLTRDSFPTDLWTTTESYGYYERYGGGNSQSDFFLYSTERATVGNIDYIATRMIGALTYNAAINDPLSFLNESLLTGNAFGIGDYAFAEVQGTGRAFVGHYFDGTARIAAISDTAPVTPVPEPATLFLLVGGLATMRVGRGRLLRRSR